MKLRREVIVFFSIERTKNARYLCFFIAIGTTHLKLLLKHITQLQNKIIVFKDYSQIVIQYDGILCNRYNAMSYPRVQTCDAN
jgi:hypothetical protein